jgi:hypothetical protein
MPYLIGIVVALASVALASLIRLERRTFYTTVLMLVATYYVLFAVIGGSSRALVIESSVMGLFVLCAVIGSRTSMWIVAAGLALHGAFDFFVHDALVTNPGMPAWWPAFCGAYDVAAAVAIAALISGRVRSPIADVSP